MSRPVLKWGDFLRFFEQNGFTVRHDGGDKVVKAPFGWRGGQTKATVRVNHENSRRKSTVVLAYYVKLICRKFQITPEEILSCR